MVVLSLSALIFLRYWALAVEAGQRRLSHASWPRPAVKAVSFNPKSHARAACFAYRLGVGYCAYRTARIRCCTPFRFASRDYVWITPLVKMPPTALKSFPAGKCWSVGVMQKHRKPALNPSRSLSSSSGKRNGIFQRPWEMVRAR